MALTQAKGSALQLDDDLAYEGLDDGIRGFHLVKFPLIQAESDLSITPTNFEYAALNVLRYNADKTGATSSDTAWQNALDVSFAAGNGDNQFVYAPAGRYLLTTKKDIHPGTKIRGDNLDFGGSAAATSFPGQLSDSRGTVIIFNPTAQQSLFVPVLPKGGSSAWSSIGIEGLNIWGNTSKSDFWRTVYGDVDPISTNSLYAFDFTYTQMASVRNCAVMGFMSAIREGDRSQNNTFNRIYIQYCREAAIVMTETTSGTEITDSVYNQVHAWNNLNFLDMQNTAGSIDPLHVRFTQCSVFTCAEDAVKIASGARETMFFDCYVEGYGLDSSVSKISGARAYPNGVNLNVIGGQYAAQTGTYTPTSASFLNTDICGGVNLVATIGKRITTGIISTANTRDNSIVLSNMQFETVTGSLIDASATAKVIGQYRLSKLDAGNNLAQVKSEYFTWTGDMQITSPTIRLGDGSSTHARPGGDNTMYLGMSYARWKEVYAAIGTINTSDEREKTEIKPITDEVLKAWEKVNYVSYRWKENTDIINFGVIAQQVVEAFKSEGLNALDYGIVVYDEWDDIHNDSGDLLHVAGNRYGVRYDQAMVLESALVRNKLAKLKV